MLCIQVWSGRFIGSWKKDNSQEWSLWFARPHFTCLNNQEISCLEEILTKYLDYILLIILFNNFLSYLSEVTILPGYKFIKKHNNRIFQRSSFKSQWYFKLALFVQFSHSVVSDSLQPHEPQHARPLCPSPTPAVYPNSCYWQSTPVLLPGKSHRWRNLVGCSPWGR